MMLFDVDDFKWYNDTYGHETAGYHLQVITQKGLIPGFWNAWHR